MKTYLTWILATLATTALAQTPAPDAITLMSMSRFDEAKTRLTRSAQQNPSMQANFDVGYGYLRAGQPGHHNISQVRSGAELILVLPHWYEPVRIDTY